MAFGHIRLSFVLPIGTFGSTASAEVVPFTARLIITFGRHRPEQGFRRILISVGCEAIQTFMASGSISQIPGGWGGVIGPEIKHEIWSEMVRLKVFSPLLFQMNGTFSTFKSLLFSAPQLSLSRKLFNPVETN